MAWRKSLPYQDFGPSHSTSTHPTASFSRGCGNRGKRSQATGDRRPRSCRIRIASLRVAWWERSPARQPSDGGSPASSPVFPSYPTILRWSLSPGIANSVRTNCAPGNPSESIDETDQRGPKVLIAARARRCSTCGVVSDFDDEQVPPPLIAWCFRAALFPGGTASMTRPTLTMSCCRALGFIGGGTCFSFGLPIHSPILGRQAQFG